MSKIEINVIMNNEFTNYFLPIAIENIQEAIKYTHEYPKFDGFVSKVNFVVTQETKYKYFALLNLDLKKLAESLHNTTKFNIITIDEREIYKVFNKVTTHMSTDTDYVAYYSANTTWVKNHLVESIKAIKLQKREWSVSFIELNSDITYKNSEAINYREPNPTNHLVNDIVIGELVVKRPALNKINFNRGIVKEPDNEFFYPAYALKAELKEYALCDVTTVRHYLELYPEDQPQYIPEDYEFDQKIIAEEDRKKIIFTVLVNVTNIHNQAQVIDALNSLAFQQFPLDNVEVLFISNYDSMCLFLTQEQLKTKFPNFRTMFTANHMQDEYGKIQILSWMNGLQQAKGEYITYLDLTEKMVYSPAYLSELYVEYKSGMKESRPQWLVSNYFDIINYTPRHSDMKALNRAQLFYTTLSHKKMDMQYPSVKAIDKNFADNSLVLLNVINTFNAKNMQGAIVPKALIQKLN